MHLKSLDSEGCTDTASSPILFSNNWVPLPPDFSLPPLLAPHYCFMTILFLFYPLALIFMSSAYITDQCTYNQRSHLLIPGLLPWLKDFSSQFAVTPTLLLP